MRPKMQALLRVLIYTGRDMLIGFILGFAAMILLNKTNPRLPGIGLLTILGLIAGVFKGLAKALILNKLDALAHDEFKKSYPKYKILGLWFAALTGVLLYSYGFDPAGWFTGPLHIMERSGFLNNNAFFWWAVMISIIFAAGLFSHYIEPPRPTFVKAAANAEDEEIKVTSE